MNLATYNDTFLPTVKCSSCAADIELSAVAEHTCTDRAPQSTRGHVFAPANESQEDLRPRRPSPLRAYRPVLPKLDSSVTNRSGLRPSEAASIAHDLGLPSPVSAGTTGHKSPHKSRSRSRNASNVRPSSPETPIGQDCAFPAFPMKNKKSQPDKETRRRPSNSANGSTNHTQVHQHSSTLSTSSSIYSTTSGYSKSRASNTSSSQQSRQGTIEDGASQPSTAPNSPRQSVLTSLSRQQSLDQSQQLPGQFFYHGSNFSEPSSTSSSMPPTPSWPFNPTDPSPRIMQSPSSEIGWTPTESTILEEQLPEMDLPKNSVKDQDDTATLIKPLTREQLRTDTLVFDNPPKESLYKTKRPSPLLQPQPSVPEDYKAPLSARAMPTAPSSSSGLGRTITNLFNRKRTHSATAKTMPLLSFDSPRLRALAPDPPERPQRNEGMWNTQISADEIVAERAYSPSRHHTVSPPAGGDSLHDSQTNLARNLGQIEQNENSPSQLTTKFNFELNIETPPMLHGQNSAEGLEYTHNTHSSQSTDRTHSRSEQDMHRISIDSASSYGSIGFSHWTASSRTDAHDSHESVSKQMPPTVDQPQPDSSDVVMPLRLKGHSTRPEELERQPNDDSKLSSTLVTQDLPLGGPINSEQSPRRPVLSPTHSFNSQDGSKGPRPSTPAGIKGRCRGCSNLIITGQKSVASADGRLSGKYHKECFVCQTCKEPFATADFYVFEDQPYCSHHYHVLNDTLCTGCGDGIEGHYLETSDVAGSSSKKFHPKCLQCSTCKTQLNEDYFEFHGRVYCEKDAFRAASGPRNPYDTVPSRPSPLVREYINSEESGLKGRFPERRTTRLIMI